MIKASTTISRSLLPALAFAAFSALCAVLLTPKITRAASATWLTNPSSSDWNTPANWVPMTVPNGPNDTATFQTSNQTFVSLSVDTEVNGFVFSSGASLFTIVDPTAITLTISGSGITNSSGLGQSFAIIGHLAFTNASRAGNYPTSFANAQGTITFSNSASAGSATFISYPGSTITFSNSATASSAAFTTHSDSGISFSDSSTAESANFTLLGGGGVIFGGNSSAANAVFTISGGAALKFINASSAGAGTLIMNGNSGDGPGGATTFTANSSAMSATLIANTASSILSAGQIFFSGSATGDVTRVQVFGNGSVDISQHAAPGTEVGSIEGDGYVFLGGKRLVVGASNTSTTFSGHIQDGGAQNDVGGSFVKTGTGTLVLTNSNTYTGGTTIESGTLRASVDHALGGNPQNGGYVSVGPGATLTLDSGATNTYIANRLSLSIVSNSTVNLNYSSNPDRIRSFILDGVTQPPGLYGGQASGALKQLSLFNGPGQILATTKAVSREIHRAAGAFDVDLPLIGSPGIECRSGGGSGGDYQLVLTFYNPVTFTNAFVIQGTGSVASTV